MLILNQPENTIVRSERKKRNIGSDDKIKKSKLLEKK